MKNSGIEWIGEIPDNWVTIKLKYIANKIERGTSPNYTDEIATRVVNQATFSKGYFDVSNLKYSIIPALQSKGLLIRGDVLLASTGGGVLGKTWYFNEDEIYVADGHVTIVRTISSYMLSKLVYYIFLINYDNFNIIMARGSTNQIELQRGLLQNMRLPVPPVEEQERIAEFLDKKCGEIDGLIADIKIQVQTLEQYKRSVITEAVTKGLNPSAEMKDSGIQWIGFMPTHWKTIRGKYLLKYLQKPVRKDDGVITCFRDGEVTLRSKRREEGFTMAEKEIGYQGVEIGDLVVHGMDGFAGAIGISDSRGKASPVLNVLDTEQNKKYIMYYLRSMAYSDVFMAMSTGIRVRSCDLRWNKLAELFYPVPPKEEQEDIVSFIDNKLKQTDDVIEQKQSQIETLESYKKSLIYEYVTGKKEVV